MRRKYDHLANVAVDGVGVVPAGKSQEFILLFQFNSEKAANLTDQRLEITKDGKAINVSI